ncbi:MAG: GNAT family N-acetyltransferase [Christensenellales bacterium]
MHIQFAAKEHSEQVIELWRQCFGDSSKFVSFYLSHHPFEEKTMLLTLEGDVVTSTLSLLPAQLVIGQKKLPVRYVYAVGTDIRFRGQGLSTALLDASASLCRRRGEAGMFLIPASDSLFEFYRQRGFVSAFGVASRTVSSSEILPYSDSDLDVRPMSLSVLAALRNHAFACLPSYIAWDEAALAYAVKAARAALGGIYGFYKGDTPVGYVFYEPQEGCMQLKEWCVPETLYAEALSALHAELGASSYRLRLPGQTPFGMLRWAEGISSPPPDSLGYANLILD